MLGAADHRALHPMSNWQLLGGTAMGEGAFSNGDLAPLKSSKSIATTMHC